jgi:predicted Zn-dependent protease
MSDAVIELGAVAENVLAIAGQAAKGAEVFASVQRSRSANVRFAKNEMTTSGEYDEVTVGVSIALGKRHASTSTNQTDPTSVKALIDRAVSMARLSPEDPESMPLLPPQQYAKTLSPFDMKLAAMAPADRAAIATRAIAEGDGKKVQIAGFFQRDILEQAVRSSTGLSAASRETVGNYTVTARTPDATGSGWGGREVHRVADLDDVMLSRTAIDKAVRSASPRPIPPGKYTVILEPQAVAEMLAYMASEMNLRSVDEGRSFFTGKIGQKLFADFVSLRSDPSDPETPSSAFDEEGMPLSPQTWIEAGVAKELFVSRYWAQKEGKKATGNHDVFKLSGGKAENIDELVRGTKRGLLVTRFWYNRMLEPQSIMLTGLTRDGLFLVEDGKVTAPVTNFRYNESPITVLKHVDAMTKKTIRTANVDGKWHVPALRTHEFTMASPSAAV